MFFIISQIFVIISYSFLAITYALKERKKILICSFLAVAANAIAFMFLSAWSGFLMSFVAMTRNVIFLFKDKNKKDKIDYVDWIILAVLYAISIVSAIFTYEGLYSLLSVAGTMIYTFAIWQKNPKLYKLLSIPSSVLWVIYNIFVFSIFGAVLESILVVCEVIGTISAYKKNKEATEKALLQERQNLERVTDILRELEKQVGPLERQSKTAKEYLSLREQPALMLSRS